MHPSITQEPRVHSLRIKERDHGDEAHLESRAKGGVRVVQHQGDGDPTQHGAWREVGSQQRRHSRDDRHERGASGGDVGLHGEREEDRAGQEEDRSPTMPESEPAAQPQQATREDCHIESTDGHEVREARDGEIGEGWLGALSFRANHHARQDRSRLHIGPREDRFPQRATGLRSCAAPDCLEPVKWPGGRSVSPAVAWHNERPAAAAGVACGGSNRLRRVGHAQAWCIEGGWRARRFPPGEGVNGVAGLREGSQGPSAARFVAVAGGQLEFHIHAAADGVACRRDQLAGQEWVAHLPRRSIGTRLAQRDDGVGEDPGVWQLSNGCGPGATFGVGAVKPEHCGRDEDRHAQRTTGRLRHGIIAGHGAVLLLMGGGHPRQCRDGGHDRAAAKEQPGGPGFGRGIRQPQGATEPQAPSHHQRQAALFAFPHEATS